MTRQRNDAHSTEFGLWLREQDEISSSLGYIASNIDYLWENYKTGEWMLIEEKRYMADLTYSQRKQFLKLNKLILATGNKKYKGFHLLQFGNTGPEDGKIFLDHKEVSKEQLIAFLQMQ